VNLRSDQGGRLLAKGLGVPAKPEEEGGANNANILIDGIAGELTPNLVRLSLQRRAGCA
jgi:hypothetical protein